MLYQVILLPPASGGNEIMNLTSSNLAAAMAPAVVNVPAGALAVMFPITTFPVAATTPVTISAGCRFGAVSVTLQVESAPVPAAAQLLLFPTRCPVACWRCDR